jgi:DNA ligase-1
VGVSDRGGTIGVVKFADLAMTSAAVTATPARNAKIELLAATLRRLAPAEIEAAAAYLSGELRQRQTGVGWTTLREVPPPAPEPSLSVAEVDRTAATIAAVTGAGSQARRRELVHRLFGAATASEQTMLRGLFSGELRQGAAAGVLVEAVAAAAGVPAAVVRRALLVSGDLRRVAHAALTGGAEALAGFTLQPGNPLSPMLAASAATPQEALAITGAPALVDTKLDGVRIQAHRNGDEVAVFSRSLDDLTGRMPEVIAVMRALPASRIVLDGEAVVLDGRGRPRPFQETAGRAATRLTSRPALSPYFFDVLHLDGEDLLDAPLARRIEALAGAVPASLQVNRVTAGGAEEVAAAFADSVAAGQEGVVVKSLHAPYEAGRRGSAWVKVKPRHTLDLVVLAVEWGHGRRRGWLSNLHLGARDPLTGGFVMLGKTFKGLTDELLRWQTRRFLELATEQNDWLVRVRPEQVVEVAFDGVQASTRYPGGVTLRFARVARYRDDKSAAEADTIDAVRAIHTRLPGPADQTDGSLP